MIDLGFSILLVIGIAFLIWRTFVIEKEFERLKRLDDLVKLLMNRELKRLQVQKEEEEKGQTRKPRTEEQKLAASQKKKEWWAKKKATETNSTIST